MAARSEGRAGPCLGPAHYNVLLHLLHLLLLRLALLWPSPMLLILFLPMGGEVSEVLRLGKRLFSSLQILTPAHILVPAHRLSDRGCYRNAGYTTCPIQWKEPPI